MAVSVRKPVLYAFGVVLCAGIIGGIWLWYRTHCVLITNDSRIEGTLVGVASRLSDRVVQVMVNEGDTVHKGQGLVRIDSRSVMARKAKAEAALELAKARWEDAKAGFRRQEIMAAQAHLDQAQAMLERAGRDFRRMEQLARNDGGTGTPRVPPTVRRRPTSPPRRRSLPSRRKARARKSSGPPKRRSCRRRPNSTRSTCCARTA